MLHRDQVRLIKQKKFWIFDMDGTLTLAVHDFPAIKKELGTPLDMDILQGISLMSEEEAEKAYRQLQEIEFRLASIGKKSPGTAELLHVLEANERYLGILTRNNQINTTETLRASELDKFFLKEYIISRDDAQPKPNPEGIYILLDKWKASPNDAVMVSDCIFDLSQSKGRFAHYLYVDPTGEFVFRDQADFCVKQLGEVLEI